jgi:hypothetical protein
MRKKTVDLHLDIGLAAVLMGGMSKRWMRDRINAGELEGFLVGKKYVVTAASVNEFLDKRRVGPGSPDAASVSA